MYHTFENDLHFLMLAYNVYNDAYADYNDLILLDVLILAHF